MTWNPPTIEEVAASHLSILHGVPLFSADRGLPTGAARPHTHLGVTTPPSYPETTPALLPSVRRYEEAAAVAIGEAADRIAERLTEEFADSLPPGSRVVFDHTPLTEGAPMHDAIVTGTGSVPLAVPDIPTSGYSRLQIELDRLEEAVNQLLDRSGPFLIEDRLEPTAELVEKGPESALGACAYRVSHLRRRIADIASRLDV